MDEIAGGKLRAHEETGEETEEGGLASEWLSCHATDATSCGSHRHSCTTTQDLARGATDGDRPIRGQGEGEEEKKLVDERSFIDFRGR